MMMYIWRGISNNGLLNVLNLNVTSISKISKSLTSILLHLNNFYSIEIVKRGSETELEVGGDSNEIICWLTG